MSLLRKNILSLHFKIINSDIHFKIINSDIFFSFLDVGYFVSNAVILHLAMTITEMVVMKNIYIFRFSRIAAINENFILTTLTSFNVVIIVINLILRLGTREFETSPCYFDDLLLYYSF